MSGWLERGTGKWVDPFNMVLNYGGYMVINAVIINYILHVQLYFSHVKFPCHYI